MVKTHTTLSIDNEIIDKAKREFINLSEAAEEGIKKRLNIKSVEIEESDHCEYCGKKMRKASRKDMNGLYWQLPDEKWICPTCDYKQIRKLMIEKI
jgi:uncharacterized protein with PIN domain